VWDALLEAEFRLKALRNDYRNVNFPNRPFCLFNGKTKACLDSDSFFMKMHSPGSGAGNLLLSTRIVTAWIVTGAAEIIEFTGVIESHCSDFHFSELAGNRKAKYATTSRWG
tara:strand:- start:17867 stop:18202 length:336 start_codon:yes stop_codon:yes gene_type:complete